MATNEILPFASTNTGTNLLTQAEYAADAQRVIGHQPGIARSKLENKALRQSSLIAAGVAEFIADYQANNVTDSLTPQQIADYLVEAIYAAVPLATTTVPGRVELATNAEAQAGTDAERAVTPAALASRTATETRTGLVEISTNAEAQDGTSDAVVLTPAKLRAALNAVNAPPVFGIRAWANFTGTASSTTVHASGNISSMVRVGTGRVRVTFATPMPDANYAVILQKPDSDQAGPAQLIQTLAESITPNGFITNSYSHEASSSPTECGLAFLMVVR